MTKTVIYTQEYPVPMLRDRLQRWRAEQRFLELRGRIVDAIESHSDNDRVRVRVDTPQNRALFQWLMAEGN